MSATNRNSTAATVPDYLRPSDHPRGGELVEPCDLPVLDRYLTGLENIPASGGGGCHTALLSIANLGRASGLAPEKITEDLAAVVHGSRRVSRSEIAEAVRKAFSTTAPDRTRPRVRVDGAKFLNAILERGAGFTEADITERSPVRIDWLPREDAVEVIGRLYAPTDLLFIGSRSDSGRDAIRSAREWVRWFEGRAPVPEHIIPNPLSGTLGKTKDGKSSYRADDCVKRFRFVTIEFDAMTRENQIRFWAGVKLPVVALIDSGGKSIHGWVRVDADDAADWAENVEEKLFDLLRPLGADGSCRNESRLSRTPGHFRREKSKMQRVLYLDPEGSEVLP